MTRATEWGLANGVPEKYKEWQPATWLDLPMGYIVLFGDKHNITDRFKSRSVTKNRFVCDTRMPLPEEKDSKIELTDINVGNPLEKI